MAEPSPHTTSDDAPILGPIARATLNDLAYDKLKRALLTGRIEPGMTLSFRQLAQDLGTSMMPVREAVARLVAERALEVIPQRGIRVPQLTPAEAEDLWSLRIQLEGEGAARAALRATPVDIARIAQLCDEVRAHAEAADLHGFLSSNSDFQFAICKAAQTRVFLTLVEMLRVQASPHRNEAIRVLLTDQPRYFHQMLCNHDDLVDAIRQRDAERARRIRQSDIEAFRAFFAQLETR
jgi:DNA-binding GntR family transcriptional regulator